MVWNVLLTILMKISCMVLFIMVLLENLLTVVIALLFYCSMQIMDAWVTPYILDRSDPQYNFYAGYDELYKSTDAGSFMEYYY